MTIQDLLNMELHEVKQDYPLQITRVWGGWIYQTYQLINGVRNDGYDKEFMEYGQGTFVPIPEVKDNPNPKVKK